MAWIASPLFSAQNASRQGAPTEIEKFQAAWEAFTEVGLEGKLLPADFNNGCGLGLEKSEKAGTTLMKIPARLVLSKYTPDQPIAARVRRDEAAGRISQTTGVLAVVVAERRRTDLPPASAKAFRALPDLKWQTTHGIFSIPEEEFNLFSFGTSMEGWQQTAFNQTAIAHQYIVSLGGNLQHTTEEEVRWAYLLFMRQPAVLRERGVVVLPLFLARPTPEPSDAAVVVAPEDPAGDWTLTMDSDASVHGSAFSFRF